MKKTISFLTFTDVHISSTNPQSRIGDYQADIFNKLQQIKLAGEKLKVDFFVFGGDLFNLKAPMRTPHEINTKLINLFLSFPAPVYATEGNHDLRADSYDTFHEQPLSVMYASKALVQARNIQIEINGMKVGIRSFPFQETPDLANLPMPPADNNINICILHLYSSPEGGSLHHTKIYSYEEISVLNDDIFVLGHYHADQGIQTFNRKNKQQIYVNVGSLCRGSISEEDIKREPKIGYVKVTIEDDKPPTYQTQPIKLKVRPASEVFNIEAKEEEQHRTVEISKFVTELSQNNIESETEGDVIKKEVSNMKIEDRVMKKVLEFIAEADLRRKQKGV